MLHKKCIMPFALAGGLVLLSGCVDSSDGLSDIDTTIGLGGGEKLTISGSSTRAIQLDEILSLQNSDFITIDSNGDYLFTSNDENTHSASTSVDKITLSDYNPVDGSIIIDLSSYAVNVRRSLAAITFDKEVASFDYEFSPLSKDIKQLNYLGSTGNINLSIVFPEQTKRVIKRIKSLTLSFPACIDLQKVKHDNTEIPVIGNSITLNDVETAIGTININAFLKGIDLTKENSSYNTIAINYGKQIDISGKIFMRGEIAQSDIDNTTGTNRVEIISKLGTSDVVINNVTGRFSTVYDFKNIGETTLNNVPDFLKDNTVSVSLYNPQIDINFNNQMPIAGEISGDIVAYDAESNQIASVSIPAFTIQSGENTVSIRRIQGTSSDNVNQVIVPDLNKVLATIPHRIAMTNVNAATDVNAVASIALGKEYSINTTYSIKAPLAFTADARIVYREKIDGWNESVNKLSFIEDGNGKLQGLLVVEADIDNKIPAHLSIEANGIDINGNNISRELLEISADKEVAASPDGKTTATTHITLTITPKSNSIFSTLDGLYIKVTGASTNAAGSNSIEGVTLNARNHTLTLRNLQVSKVGKIIGNFN